MQLVSAGWPLANIQKATEFHRKSSFLMGKSTIDGPFSIAMVN